MKIAFSSKLVLEMIFGDRMRLCNRNGNIYSFYDVALQVIRYGTLRVTFSPSYKVLSLNSLSAYQVE